MYSTTSFSCEVVIIITLSVPPCKAFIIVLSIFIAPPLGCCFPVLFISCSGSVFRQVGRRRNKSTANLSVNGAKIIYVQCNKKRLANLGDLVGDLANLGNIIQLFYTFSYLFYTLSNTSFYKFFSIDFPTSVTWVFNKRFSIFIYFFAQFA